MTQLWRVGGFSADEAAHAVEINLHIPVFLRQIQEEQASAAAQRLTHAVTPKVPFPHNSAIWQSPGEHVWDTHDREKGSGKTAETLAFWEADVESLRLSQRSLRY
jgi:hypothetical protein